jgi:hypothetical protein
MEGAKIRSILQQEPTSILTSATVALGTKRRFTGCVFQTLSNVKIL